MPRVVHFEIHADEPERAIRFYSEIFGWRFAKWEGPQDFWFITTGPSDAPGIDGGLIPRRGTDTREDAAITSYICTIDVPSVDLYLDTVVAQGGSVAMAKMPIPDGSGLAYARDPDGNLFGLMERATPQPADPQP